MNEPTLAEETRKEIKGTIQELFLDDIKADFEELKKTSSDSLEKIKAVRPLIEDRANAMPEAIANNTEIKDLFREVVSELKQLILDKKHPIVNAEHLSATEKNLNNAIGDKHKKAMEEIKKIKTDLKDFATVSDLKKKLNVAYFLIVLQILITLAILVMGIL